MERQEAPHTVADAGGERRSGPEEPGSEPRPAPRAPPIAIPSLREARTGLARRVVGIAALGRLLARRRHPAEGVAEPHEPSTEARPRIRRRSFAAGSPAQREAEPEAVPDAGRPAERRRDVGGATGAGPRAGARGDRGDGSEDGPARMTATEQTAHGRRARGGADRRRARPGRPDRGSAGRRPSARRAGPAGSRARLERRGRGSPRRPLVRLGQLDRCAGAPPARRPALPARGAVPGGGRDSGRGRGAGCARDRRCDGRSLGPRGSDRVGRSRGRTAVGTRFPPFAPLAPPEPLPADPSWFVPPVEQTLLEPAPESPTAGHEAASSARPRRDRRPATDPLKSSSRRSGTCRARVRAAAAGTIDRCRVRGSCSPPRAVVVGLGRPGCGGPGAERRSLSAIECSLRPSLRSTPGRPACSPPVERRCGGRSRRCRR